MACPLRYGFSPAEEKRWRGLHLLLLKECPDYDSVADEPFVHRCITEEVLDPAERSDRETILELYAARHASPPPAPTATDAPEWRVADNAGDEEDFETYFESFLETVDPANRDWERQCRQTWRDRHYLKWVQKGRPLVYEREGVSPEELARRVAEGKGKGKGKGKGQGKGKGWKGEGPSPSPGSHPSPGSGGRGRGAGWGSPSGWGNTDSASSSAPAARWGQPAPNPSGACGSDWSMVQPGWGRGEAAPRPRPAPAEAPAAPAPAPKAAPRGPKPAPTAKRSPQRAGGSGPGDQEADPDTAEDRKAADAEAAREAELLSRILPNPKVFLEPDCLAGCTDLNAEFPSLKEYTQTLFSLLRADLLWPVCDDVQAWGQGEALGPGRMPFHDVRLEGTLFTLAGVAQLLSFVPERNQPVPAQALRYGNLICLSCDGFETVYYASVASSDADLRAQGLVLVTFCGDHLPRWQAQCRATGAATTMWDSAAFLLAYQPVLRNLLTAADRMAKGNPVTDALRVPERNDCPPYVADSAPGALEELVEATGRELGLELDGAQVTALTTALTHTLAAVQGPPGTGKTFVAGLLTRLLLRLTGVGAAADAAPAVSEREEELRGELAQLHEERATLRRQRRNKPAYGERPLDPATLADIDTRLQQIDAVRWDLLVDLALEVRRAYHLTKAPASGPPPIVILAFKNLSLDHLLEQCLEFEPNILRLGTRTQSEALLPYNLALQVAAARCAAKGRETSLRQAVQQDEDVEELARVFRKDLRRRPGPGCAAPTGAAGGGLHPGTRYSIVALVEAVRRYDWQAEEAAPPPEVVLHYATREQLHSLTRGQGGGAAAGLEAVQAALQEWLQGVALDERDARQRCADDVELRRQQQAWSTRPTPAAAEDAADEEEEAERKAELLPNRVVCAYDEELFIPTRSPMPEAEWRAVTDVWRCGAEQRRALLAAWLAQHRAAQAAEYCANFEAAKNKAQRRSLAAKADLLRSARVVGMTTTGAAMSMALLERVRPRVVLVEEAAELLEPQLLGSLPASVQHVILFGDHKQLRPFHACHRLGEEPYSLNVSVFERLAGHPGFEACTMLRRQHRMHPDISAVVSHQFYSGLLQDAEGLEARRLEQRPLCAPGLAVQHPAVGGVVQRLFFAHVSKGEEERQRGGTSLFNRTEATFVARFAGYLVKACGVRLADLVVLCMYRGQLAEVAKELERVGIAAVPHGGEDDALQVTTCDAFQGSERNVVLLSTVRARTWSVGFLADERRMCVALSRARHALFIFGDQDTLERSPPWKAVLQEVKCVPSVQLTCLRPGHAAVLKKVSTAYDFPDRPLPCREALPAPCPHRHLCSHVCAQPTCHFPEEHELGVLCPTCKAERR